MWDFIIMSFVIIGFYCIILFNMNINEYSFRVGGVNNDVIICLSCIYCG